MASSLPMSVRFSLAVTVLGGMLAAVAIAGSTGDAAPRFQASYEPSECMFSVPSGQDPECGWLTVPAIRDRAGSGTIRLPVAVFRSAAAAPAPDPVVYLAGGPGEHALEAASLLFNDAFGPFLDERDVILFDQRGAGLAEPSLACPELVRLAEDDMERHLSPEGSIREHHAAALACNERLMKSGIDLRAFTTAESAADVADLRIALGYERWNLLGISYGTRLAQTVLRDHPEGVGAAVLDSAYPLDVDLFAGIYAGVDRAFAMLFDACAADLACAAAYPDLRDALDAAFDRLNAVPLRSTVGNPLTGESFEALHAGGDLFDVLFQGLYSASVIPLLPELIANAAHGEAGALDVLRGLGLANRGFISDGMQLTLQCAEEVASTSKQALQAAARGAPYVERLLRESSGIGDDIVDLCEAWGAGPPGAVENQPVTSKVPVLVLGGAFDPVTPPTGGREVAEALGNAAFIELPRSGHAVVAEGGCGQTLALAFFAAPRSPVRGTCLGDIPPIKWALPIDTVEMVPFEDPLFGIAGVRPAGWKDQGLGVVTRTSLGLVSVAQQRLPGIPAEQALGLFARTVEQALGTSLEARGMLAANGGDWELLATASAGQSIVLALREEHGGTSLIVATGFATQTEALIDLLVGPTAAGFALLDG